MYEVYLTIGGVVLVAVAAAVVYPYWRRQRMSALSLAARKLFQQRREWLEARFLSLASESGKPRGLEWVDCDFNNEVTYARNLKTGELHAFVAVTIKFEAIEGGGMEDVEAVGNHKAASAVFCFDGKEWTTDGRTIFNLNPEEAVEHYHLHQLETVD